MNLLDAIILGILQGLTEFLPVSSSGHLEIGKALLGLHMGGEESLLFTVVVHFATAAATLVVYRREVGKIISGLFQFKNNEETQFVGLIVLSMIPAGVVGLLFEKQIEALFEGKIAFVGAMLIVTGLLLFVADKSKASKKSITSLNAFLIGIAQAIAILPGISRSGATISTSVILGVDREQAARFSFLMVIPVIFGKILLDAGDMIQEVSAVENPTQVSFPVLLAGFASAFLVGIFACNLMIAMVKRAQLKYFSFYCFVVGFVSIVSYYYY
ncbi:undecaprenyl-diphosphatase [Thermaurantimonas aggregans]|uniref:Undecaprenyl-diphosphatase n=1 Tax=Thermaurantimonas aggregans TaxID=2173829 RepID=A0A401XM02_9FLAO|nr:undecaprenyl-diphosphate phosphatase [Thermaurantimonas aggregans]MCX8149506.1 undecaprenyl-diphosphate phosphatase [Thermaurantimonas aggregans]GCD78018.1 undecaprenyl-diphosphatase [Thermaurantimonas aggregans]